MGIKTRAHVLIEENIAKEIDRFVGKKKRSAFISEAAKKELKRLKQLSLIRKLKGTRKDENHRELSGKEDSYIIVGEKTKG